jgi:hypothetical protein
MQAKRPSPWLDDPNTTTGWTKRTGWHHQIDSTKPFNFTPLPLSYHQLYLYFYNSLQVIILTCKISTSSINYQISTTSSHYQKYYYRMHPIRSGLSWTAVEPYINNGSWRTGEDDQRGWIGVNQNSLMKLDICPKINPTCLFFNSVKTM